MKEIFRTVCDFLFGALFVAAAFIGYLPDPIHMGEYSFIANVLVGAVLIVSGIYYLATKKRLPLWVYFDCMVALLAIFVVTAAVGVNLYGVFWFIHIVDPLLMFVYWYATCDHTELRHRVSISSAAIFPALYACFAFVFWQSTGVCPFPASLFFIGQPLELGLGGAVVTVAMFIVLAFALDATNRFVYHRAISEPVPKAVVE